MISATASINPQSAEALQKALGQFAVKVQDRIARTAVRKFNNDVIKAARARIDAHRAAGGQEIWLEVDGGVKTDNIRAIGAAGADTFVAGSAVFGAKDYRAVISAMRAELAII